MIQAIRKFNMLYQAKKWVERYEMREWYDSLFTFNVVGCLELIMQNTKKSKFKFKYKKMRGPYEGAVLILALRGYMEKAASYEILRDYSILLSNLSDDLLFMYEPVTDQESAVIIRCDDIAKEIRETLKLLEIPNV